MIYILAVIAISGTFLSAQSKLSLGIGGIYASPTGDFGDVYKDGFGGLASLNYSLTDNIQLSVSSGYEQFSFNNEKFNQLLTDFFSSFGTTYNVSVDAKLKVIPILLGGKYFLTNTNFRPYAALDLGVDIISVDGSSIKVNGETMDAVKSESKVATAWGIGVGFIYRFAHSISLDVNGKINGNSLQVGTNFSASSGGNSSSQSSNSTVTYFSIGAGLIFEL